MANLTSAINIQIDSETKKQATAVLSDLGLSMSTAINLFLKQVIKRDGLPFEVVNPKPNKELLEALEEGEQIIQEIKAGKRTGYKNMTNLINALNKD